jgi:uncharacterized iron-regulated membrane protein
MPFSFWSLYILTGLVSFLFLVVGGLSGILLVLKLSEFYQRRIQAKHKKAIDDMYPQQIIELDQSLPSSKK